MKKETNIISIPEYFLNWVEAYFAPSMENYNRMIQVQTLYCDFLNVTKVRWTTQQFRKHLRAYFSEYDSQFIINPIELQTHNGRIIKKIDGKTTEMIYVQTRKDYTRKIYRIRI